MSKVRVTKILSKTHLRLLWGPSQKSKQESQKEKPREVKHKAKRSIKSMKWWKKRVIVPWVSCMIRGSQDWKKEKSKIQFIKMQKSPLKRVLPRLLPNFKSVSRWDMMKEMKPKVMYTNCKGVINPLLLIRLSSCLKTKSLPGKSWEKRFKITFTISIRRAYPLLLAKRRFCSLRRKSQESLREKSKAKCLIKL